MSIYMDSLTHALVKLKIQTSNSDCFLWHSLKSQRIHRCLSELQCYTDIHAEGNTKILSSIGFMHVYAIYNVKMKRLRTSEGEQRHNCPFQNENNKGTPDAVLQCFCTSFYWWIQIHLVVLVLNHQYLHTFFSMLSWSSHYFVHLYIIPIYVRKLLFQFS